MIIHSEPLFSNHSTMVCNWVDDKGNYIFQERAYWPRNIGGNRSVHYWATDILFTNKSEADKEAALFGFVSQLGFYCSEEEPHWFPIFENFEKCCKYLEQINKVSIQSE